jgi:hypothetical protein
LVASPDFYNTQKETAMRRILSIAAFLSVCCIVPLAAQDEVPHNYRINYVQVLDAKYYTYLTELLYPMYDYWVEKGLIVSYDGIRQYTGAGEVTMLGITELPSWDAAMDFTDEEYAEASQAVHGKPWADAMEGFVLAEMRKIIRREFYWSIKP